MSNVVKRLKASIVGATMAATLVTVGGTIVVGSAIAASQNMTATTNVNMRSGPATTYSILTVVPAGATVKATGTTSGVWVQVSYQGQSGYIHGSYLSGAASSDTTSTSAAGSAVTTTDVNVRSGPGTSYSVVDVAASGTKVQLTGTTSGNWSQIIWQGSERWISTSYLSTSGSPAGSSTATYGQVKTTAALNMRTDGNIDAPVVAVLPANSIVDVTGQTTESYTQILFQGQKVWISNKYIVAVTSSPTLLSSTMTTKQAAVVDYARSKVGGPYVWGGSGPTGFDCSGLTMMAYQQIGISLPHHAADQINLGTPVSKANMQPGDLIFWYSPVSHVSMYIGNGKMAHARNTTVGIVEQTVDSYTAPIAGIRRYIG